MNARRHAGKWLLYTVIVLTAIIIVTMFMPDWQQSKKMDPDPAQQGPGVQGSEIYKVRIRLDEPPNMSHAFIYAADMMGYFREEGLSLELIGPQQPADVLEQTAAGDLDIAVVPAPEVLFALQRNVPVVSIASVTRGPLTYLTVPHQSAIQTPRNLAGLKAALGAYPHYEAILKTMIEEDGGDPEEVAIVSAERSYGSILKEQAADAMIGPNVIQDRMELEQQGMQVRMIEPTLYGVPAFYERVLAAGRESVEERPDVFAKALSALIKGYQFVQEYPETAAQYVQSRQPQEDRVDAAIALESIFLLRPFMESEDHPFGTQSPKVWKDTVSWLESAGMLDSSIDHNDAFVQLDLEK